MAVGTEMDKPQRWDVQFGPGMNLALVRELLSHPPFNQMDEAVFPDRTPLHEILLNLLFNAVEASYATQDTIITAAEMLDLVATPKAVLAAPGANKAVSVHGVLFFFEFNSIVYANTTQNVQVRYTADAGNPSLDNVA